MASLYSDKADRNLNALVARQLIGTARADVSCLDFFQGRQTDHQVVKHLLEVFCQIGCRRYDPDNFIPVLITKADLNIALQASGLNRTALQGQVQEGLPHILKTAKKQTLSCAHGRHRIEAAKQFLPEDDQRWTIKIFLVKSKSSALASFDLGSLLTVPSDEFKKLAALWKHSFHYEAVLSDGEIYRQVRTCKKAGDTAQVETLTAYLSDSKQNCQRQLLNHKGLTAGLDALLDIPGMWGPDSLKYGNAQTILALRCDEVILMRQTSFFLGG